MKLISGSSNTKLAQTIAEKLQLQLVNIKIGAFGNHEKRVQIQDNLRGEDVILVQSLSEPTDSHIIETLLIIDALERMAVNDVYLVIPWFGYSFQDKIFKSGEPLSAKVIASIISHSYAKKIFLLDLHNPSIPGFFSVPTDIIQAESIFMQFVKQTNDLDNAVVASPDFGGLKKARKLSKALNLPLVNIDKSRDLQTGKVSSHSIHGDVSGKSVYIYDDAIMSGGTVVSSAEILKKSGAKKVTFMATHGILCNDAIPRISKSQVDEVVVSNSIQNDLQNNSKFKIIDCSDLFIERLKYITTPSSK